MFKSKPDSKLLPVKHEFRYTNSIRSCEYTTKRYREPHVTPLGLSLSLARGLAHPSSSAEAVKNEVYSFLAKVWQLGGWHDSDYRFRLHENTPALADAELQMFETQLAASVGAFFMEKNLFRWRMSSDATRNFTAEQVWAAGDRDGGVMISNFGASLSPLVGDDISHEVARTTAENAQHLGGCVRGGHLVVGSCGVALRARPGETATLAIHERVLGEQAGWNCYAPTQILREHYATVFRLIGAQALADGLLCKADLGGAAIDFSVINEGGIEFFIPSLQAEEAIEACGPERPLFAVYAPAARRILRWAAEGRFLQPTIEDRDLWAFDWTRRMNRYIAFDGLALIASPVSLDHTRRYRASLRRGVIKKR